VAYQFQLAVRERQIGTHRLHPIVRKGCYQQLSVNPLTTYLRVPEPENALTQTLRTLPCSLTVDAFIFRDAMSGRMRVSLVSPTVHADLRRGLTEPLAVGLPAMKCAVR
jgi:hypothetical protein